MDTIGEKIRNYRLRSGMSQMELELAIDASFGSVSRIESGKVNPTKETLQKISQILKLMPYEEADLFSLDTNYYINVLKSSTGFIQITDLGELLQKATDVIAHELKLLGVMIDIVRDGILYNQAITYSWYTKVINKIIGAPFKSFTFKIQEGGKDIVTRAFLEQKIFHFYHLREIGEGMFSNQISELLNKATKFQAGIVFPIVSSYGEGLGVIYFGKDYKDDFSIEMPILQAFTDAVGVAMENAIKYEKMQNQLNDAKHESE